VGHADSLLQPVCLNIHVSRLGSGAAGISSDCDGDLAHSLVGDEFHRTVVCFYLRDHIYLLTLQPISHTFVRLQSSYASSRLLASTYYSSSDTMVKFTPVEQMRANVKGCAAGFSLCLALNGLLYVCRWAEIKYDPAASKGSKAIANYAVKMYSATTACFFGAFALASATSDEYYEDETSAHCRWLWFGAIVVLYGSLAFWTSTYGALDEYEAKTHSVPMSVTYVIVRVGEVTSLNTPRLLSSHRYSIVLCKLSCSCVTH